MNGNQRDLIRILHNDNQTLPQSLPLRLHNVRSGFLVAGQYTDEVVLTILREGGYGDAVVARQLIFHAVPKIK